MRLESAATNHSTALDSSPIARTADAALRNARKTPSLCQSQLFSCYFAGPPFSTRTHPSGPVFPESPPGPLRQVLAQTFPFWKLFWRLLEALSTVPGAAAQQF